jgi:hypothetical protein
MTTTEFIKAKKASFKPEFKDLAGLKESTRTSELMDFMSMLHPNQCKKAQGSTGEVFAAKHYVFNIYTTGILRTVVETKERRFFPHKIV